MALKRGIVELENYNKNWKVEYDLEEKLLTKVLKDYLIEIEHVGSTSIVGLSAKPVIDILVVINSLNDIEKIEGILSEYDYSNRGPQGVSDRMFFAKGPEDSRTHYIHFVEPNSTTYYNLILFKRYLNDFPEYIDKYCELKKTLASKYANERSKYTSGKSEFIQDVVAKAKKEYGIDV